MGNRDFKPLGVQRAPERIEVRPKPQRTPTRFPQKPRMYAKLDKPEQQGGPGEPPPGFVMPSTSITEWKAFWAIWKALNAPGEPRNGPWMGPVTGEFEYQSYALGGRRQLGGAVVDFLVRSTDIPLGIRIVTEYFHIFAGEEKRAADFAQAIELGKVMQVIDVYDYEFLNLDPQGLVVYFKQAMGLIKSNPIASGTARRNR